MLLKLSPIITLFFISVSSEKFRFDNYSLYKVLPKNLDQIKVLGDLQHASPEYDFWDDPVPTADYINIMSKPEMRNDLETFLNKTGIDFVVTLPNVQEIIDSESRKPYNRNNIKSMKWDAYYPLEEIYDWLDDLAKAYPDIVTIIVGGKTYEGRDIKGVKISHGPGKRAVFIESGIHAREWIAPATVNFITNELLTSSDEEIKAVARDYDWYIFPVTNPDGYVWSHVGFRLWRKNRKPYGTGFGVDLNRNWNDNWLKESVSTNVASDVFAGPGPFSEIETRTLSTYIMNMADKIDLYLSFHSSGQILLLPFGNTTEPLSNYDDAMKIGIRAMGALSVRYRTPYTIGNIAEAIYFATGTSIDWVKERLHVPLVYCYELRDRGTYGHLLPPDQILPTAEETMDSIVEMILQAKRFGYMNVNAAVTQKVSIFIIFAVLAKFLF
ncbi:zinc carboxypeptidase-like [Trichoplusia ni]|uniref:Zinc carboxypeptidase-like n=1 Tax=Trichoplusia ni TaxID=7111 RepID=A0A7E5WQL9_TRINI|nr:zinc carboxypeptidase-like [Trichoplusia ni]